MLDVNSLAITAATFAHACANAFAKYRFYASAQFAATPPVSAFVFRTIQFKDIPIVKSFAGHVFEIYRMLFAFNTAATARHVFQQRINIDRFFLTTSAKTKPVIRLLRIGPFDSKIVEFFADQILCGAHDLKLA